MTGTRPAAARIGVRGSLVLALPAVAAIAFLALPLAGVLSRAPWSGLAGRLTAPDVTEALGLSLTVSFWALGLSLLFGVPLAWLLARTEFRGKTLVRALVMLPMVLPPTVGGVALLMGFGRRGLLGPALEDWFGITLPFSTPGAVVAAAFVAMPFLVTSLEGTLSGLHTRYEETAASLGATPLRAYLTVTLPMAAPGLVAAAALCWARALGEFGATITFAGNLPGVTQTLPLKVYLMLEDDPDGATAVSLLLLAVALAVLVALRGRWTGVSRAPRPAAQAGEEPAPVPPQEQDAGPPEDPVPPPASQGWPLETEVSGYTSVALSARPGTTIAVVGPNGAGKTTLLRALLGLTRRSTADLLALGGEQVAGRPPHRRGVAWVPQDGALFPHMSSLANTAYGLRAQGVPRRAARAQAQLWLDRLGVGELAGRKPGRLSGGQAGRVALARALAARPRLLLLDEPLAALDATTRSRVRHTLRRHLSGFPGVCLIVTHDPVEAVSLADRVLVLEGGRAVQYAPPAEVARHPRSPWVARMLGRNAWAGRGTAEGLRLDGGAHVVTAESVPEGAPALAVVGPEAVSLHRERPSGSPRNVWHGTVRELTASGGRMRVLVTTAVGLEVIAEVTTAAAGELALAEGQRVWLSVKATEITVVPL